MNPLWWLVAIPCAGIGAVGRVWITQATERRLPGGAPTATGLINVAGAALIGVIAGIGGDTLMLVVGAGLLGGFTTFSTWMVEVDAAHRVGHVRAALLTLILPLAIGVAACAATRALA